MALAALGRPWLDQAKTTIRIKTIRTSSPESKIVDNGSFGVFMNGRRVATEKFSIQQDSQRQRRHVGVQN